MKDIQRRIKQTRSIRAPKPDLGGGREDLKRDMRDLSDLDGMRARRWPSVTSDLAPVGAYDFHFDSAGREWCRDADDLCWIKPAPDGPWYRQNKSGGDEQ